MFKKNIGKYTKIKNFCDQCNYLSLCSYNSDKFLCDQCDRYKDNPFYFFLLYLEKEFSLKPRVLIDFMYYFWYTKPDIIYLSFKFKDLLLTKLQNHFIISKNDEDLNFYNYSINLKPNIYFEKSLLDPKSFPIFPITLKFILETDTSEDFTSFIGFRLFNKNKDKIITIDI